MIDLQPALDEMKNTRGMMNVKHPELVKLYMTHDDDELNKAMNQHWRNVDQGLTSEYVQLLELTDEMTGGDPFKGEDHG